MGNAHLGLVDLHHRISVRARLLIEDERIAHDLRTRSLGPTSNFHEAPIGAPPPIFANRFRGNDRRSVGRAMHHFAASVLMLTMTSKGNGEDLAVCPLTAQVH